MDISNITIEKIDDINYIVKGSIDNTVIEQKVEQLKEAAKDDTENDMTDEQIEQEAASQAFREFIDAGIEKAEIEVETLLGQPGLKKYEKKQDEVLFEVEIATSPEINLDVSLDDVIPSFTKPTASPEDIEKKLLEFATNQAPFTKIDNPKAVENGDVAVIDFKGYIEDEAFEGGSAEKYNLKIGSQSFIEGFEEQIIGMEYGEERDIIVTFPKDYSSADLAGKEAKFVVKLHEVQLQKPLEINDEFAQNILGDKNATVATLKEKFSDQIISQEISHIYMTTLKPQIIEKLLTKFNFTLPNNIVEQEIAVRVQEFISQLPQEEQKTIIEDKDKFLELRESVKNDAKNTIKKALIVEALAKKEGVEADEQEAYSALTYQAMMSGQDAQQLVQYYKENNLMNSVILALIEDKLFGQMLGLDKTNK